MKKVISLVVSFILAMGTLGVSAVSANSGTVDPNHIAANATIAAQNTLSQPLGITSATKADKAAAEAEILNMQKDAVKAIRGYVTGFAEGGFKETGKVNYAMNVDTGDQKISVSFKLDDYTSIANLVRKGNELSVSGQLQVSMSGSKTNYEATPTGKDEDGFDTYPKVPSTLEASVHFKADVKMVDGAVYALLSEFSTSRSGTADEIKQFDEMIDGAQKYVGKTYKIPLESSSSSFVDQGMLLQKLYSALNVLDTQSLLEVKSMRGNVYVMRAKQSTLNALAAAFGEKKAARNAAKNGPEITMTMNNGTTVLKVVDKSSRVTSTLTKTGADYSLNVVSHRGIRRGTGSDFDMTLTANSLDLAMSNRTKYAREFAQETVRIIWKNQRLDAGFESTSHYDKPSAWYISWPLDIWAGNMDLAFMYNDKSVGKVTLSKNDSTYTYSIGAWYDMSQLTGSPSSFKIDLSGNSTIEQWLFDIPVPTDFEILDILKNGNSLFDI